MFRFFSARGGQSLSPTWGGQSVRQGNLRCRRLGAALCGVGLLLMGLMVFDFGRASPAAANPHVDLRGAGVKVNDAWLGSYRTFGGDPWVWCIDAGKKSPFSDYAWSSREVTAPKAGYLLWKYGKDAEAINHAALSFLMHKSAELPHAPVRKIPEDAPERSGAKLRERVNELEKEARKFAGPYEVELKIRDDNSNVIAHSAQTGAAEQTKEDNEPGEAATAANSVLAWEETKVELEVAVTSAQGNHVPKVPLELAIQGPGQWENKATSLEITSESKPLVLPLDVLDAGELAISVVAQTPPTSVQIWEATQNGVQRVVSANGRHVQNERVNLLIEEPLEIAVTTKTSQPASTGTAEVHDELEVAVLAGQWPEGYAISVESTLYGPFEDQPELQDKVPADAPEVTTVLTTLTKPGSARTEDVAVSEPGWYVWHEKVAPGSHHRAWNGEFGVATEIFELMAPPADPPTDPPPETVPPEPEDDPEPELPATGGSLALGLIGGGALLTGAGTMGVARLSVSSGTGGKRRK